MTRLAFGAFGANSALADRLASSSGATVVASPFTGGGPYALECIGAAGNVFVFFSLTPTENRGYYCRARVRISATPTADTFLIGFGNPTLSGDPSFGIALQSGSRVARLRAGGTGGFVGANGPTLAVDTDYLLEVYALYNQVTTLTDFIGGRVNGVDIDTTQSGAWTTTTPTAVSMGLTASAGITAHYTDWAINDDQGADNNSWCGDARVAMLLPVSDDTGNSTISADAWRLINSGTTNLYTGVDNVPPTGIASPGSGTSQIVVDTPSTARNYVAVTNTYTAAGIAAGDTITLVQGLVWHAESITTGSKTGTIDLFANPSTSTQAITFGNNAGLAGTWPASWYVDRTPVSVLPTPTRGTGASIRVTADTSTRNSDVCFMAAYVEYTVSVATTKSPPPFSRPWRIWRSRRPQ